MLLPYDIKPEHSIFYNSYQILKIIKTAESNLNLVDLYYLTKINYDTSLKIFSYCLDWLYLIELVEVNSEGEVTLCT